ncbi:MAG: cyclic nucleotide-binding domain-containing protein [Planctomycetes bacterium]|nr:cyclic nucleotide-binding domain-containing protein [Planctomycetota bacterium]NUQ36180.1 cyclic nucleotide-binding domain-containing protein [Planctomycetaceae bacterium]
MENQFQSFQDGQIVCRQNEPANDVFVLVNGKVEILVNDNIEGVPDDATLRDARSLNVIDKAGTIIGEAGVWIGARTATLIARGLVSLNRLPMPPAEAEAFAARRPDVGMNIASTMAARIAETEGKSKSEMETLAMLEDARDAASMDIAKVVDALPAFATSHSDQNLMKAAEAARAHPMYRHALKLRETATDSSRLISDVIADALKDGIQTLNDGHTLRKSSDQPNAAFIVMEGGLDVFRGDRRVGSIRAGSIADIVPCLYGIKSGARNTELRAKGSTRVVRVPREAVADACTRSPKLLIAVLRTLASELRSANMILSGASRALGAVKAQLVGATASVTELSNALLPAMEPYPKELRLELDRVRQNRDEVGHLLEMFGL